MQCCLNLVAVPGFTTIFADLRQGFLRLVIPDSRRQFCNGCPLHALQGIPAHCEVVYGRGGRASNQQTLSRKYIGWPSVVRSVLGLHVRTVACFDLLDARIVRSEPCLYSTTSHPPIHWLTWCSSALINSCRNKRHILDDSFCSKLGTLDWPREFPWCFQMEEGGSFCVSKGISNLPLFFLKP